MQTYKVKITEICSCVVEVYADDEEEAYTIADKKYWKNPNDYVLEPEETKIEVEGVME